MPPTHSMVSWKLSLTKIKPMLHDLRAESHGECIPIWEALSWEEHPQKRHEKRETQNELFSCDVSPDPQKGDTFQRTYRLQWNHFWNLNKGKTLWLSTNAQKFECTKHDMYTHAWRAREKIITVLCDFFAYLVLVSQQYRGRDSTNKYTQCGCLVFCALFPFKWFNDISRT